MRRAHQSGLLTAARAEAAVSLAESERARAESERAVAETQRAMAESQRAVADERLRIARELHDVVAHSMSLIAVQAGVGAHLIHRDPQAAERALEVIADTSREALAQARSVIGLLRTGDDAQPSLPGLTALGPLVQGGAGCRVAGRADGARGAGRRPRVASGSAPGFHWCGVRTPASEPARGGA